MQIDIETVFRQPERLVGEIANTGDMRPLVRRFGAYIFFGSAVYGVAMGLRHSLLQASVSAGKVPALFLLTLLVCLPTLHFVGLLYGSRLQLRHTVAVLLGGMAVTSILLGAFMPIALFFLAIGSRYEFLVLLHVAIFTFCGGAGLCWIHGAFTQLRDLVSPDVPPERDVLVLRAWMLLYMFVGTQMAYTLSPFIGRDQVFWWFHTDGGNFYSYVLSLLGALLR